MGFIEISDSQDLRIGVFVKLEGSWFSHPFPTNTFKIKSAEDLATIQGLKNVTILYDPDRSGSEDVEEVQETDPESRVDPEALLDDEEAESSSIEEADVNDSDPPLISDSSLTEILDRREDFQEYQDHLRKMEGAYQKILGQSNDLFRQINGKRPSGLKVADSMVNSILNASQNQKTTMSLIDVVGSNGVGWGLSEHALNVCTLSLLIGRQFKLDSDTLMDLGRGALFHDVGYRVLPMKVQFANTGMKVKAEPGMQHRHPELGRNLMASFSETSPQVLDIISQHHECLDGSGFPGKVEKEDLSLLTKIVMVADRFDELCNAPDIQTSLSPHAALSRLFRHVVLKGETSKYCPHVVQALVQAIGVYPPGSLVELSDGFLGVVSSINAHNPTKPIVLLYAPWLCRTDGLLVNLESDPELEIAKAVHAKDIPEQVLAYLSPRRMAMFVHATDTTTMAKNTKRASLGKKMVGAS